MIALLIGFCALVLVGWCCLAHSGAQSEEAQRELIALLAEQVAGPDEAPGLNV